CPPVLGVHRADHTVSERTCTPEIQRALVQGIQRLKLHGVALVARWSLYQHGWRQGGVIMNNTHFLCDTNCGARASSASSLRVLRGGFRRLTDTLAPATHLVVVEGVPMLAKLASDIVA